MDKRVREAPLIDANRDLVMRRVELAGHDPDAQLFTGPRGGQIATATLRFRRGPLLSGIA